MILLEEAILLFQKRQKLRRPKKVEQIILRISDSFCSCAQIHERRGVPREYNYSLCNPSRGGSARDPYRGHRWRRLQPDSET